MIGYDSIIQTRPQQGYKPGGSRDTNEAAAGEMLGQLLLFEEVYGGSGGGYWVL